MLHFDLFSLRSTSAVRLHEDASVSGQKKIVNRPKVVRTGHSPVALGSLGYAHRPGSFQSGNLGLEYRPHCRPTRHVLGSRQHIQNGYGNQAEASVSKISL